MVGELITGTLETKIANETEAQQIWHIGLGKALGFPPTGSDALWPTSSEKFDGAGTTLHKTFPNITYTTITWLSLPDGAKQAIPLMTRVVGRTHTNINFLAGLYGVNEATKTYTNKKGEKYVARNVSREDLVSAYNRLHPNLRTKTGRAVQAGEQSQLTEWTGEADEDRATLEKLPEGYQLTRARMKLIDLINQMDPIQENLFEKTQQEVLKHGRSKWLMTIIKPGRDGNPHYEKYRRDGFRPFTPIADELIKYMDKLDKQGHDALGEVNRYFEAIRDAGESEVLEGAIWMIRPPNNNKGILEVVESITSGEDPEFPTGWQTQLGDFGKSDSWKIILKAETIDFNTNRKKKEEEEESEKEEVNYETPKPITSGGRHGMYVRETGETLIDPDTDKEVQGGNQLHDSPLGRQSVVNTNFQGSCCEQLKERLIDIVAYKKSNIHTSEIVRKIRAMPCHELNEYMEPPNMEDNNFLNLKIFGVNIAALNEYEVYEAIGVQGKDVHTALWEEYDECIREQLGSLQSPKPPTERTDPAQREHDVKISGTGETEVGQTEEEQREFEGFDWDMGKPGVLDYDKREAQRVALIQDRRKFLGQDPDEGEWGKEFMPETLHQEDYERQVEAQLKPSERDAQIIVAMLETGLTLQDMKVWRKVGFSDAKIKYTIDNWNRLKNEYGLDKDVY